MNAELKNLLSEDELRIMITNIAIKKSKLRDEIHQLNKQEKDIVKHLLKIKG